MIEPRTVLAAVAALTLPTSQPRVPEDRLWCKPSEISFTIDRGSYPSTGLMDVLAELVGESALFYTGPREEFGHILLLDEFEGRFSITRKGLFMVWSR